MGINNDNRISGITTPSTSHTQGASAPATPPATSGASTPGSSILQDLKTMAQNLMSLVSNLFTTSSSKAPPEAADTIQELQKRDNLQLKIQ